MNLIYTVLLALPIGLLIASRSTAIVTYLLIGSYLFSFQNTSVLLSWLGHSSKSAFGPFPDSFPAQAVDSEVFGYAVTNVLITLVGVGLVVLGGWLRARRVARRDIVAVS